MPYGKTKVYHDGSHYIAIPPSKRKKRPKRPQKEELVTVVTEANQSQEVPENEQKQPVSVRLSTRKELFEEEYRRAAEMPKRERKKYLKDRLGVYFTKEDDVKNFVEVNLERKRKNLTARKVRLLRKANLQEFNYFCTFTYDGGKHTEESFKKKLKNTLSLFAYRKGWKYMGVWERSPEKHRLHFHGLFYIPEGTMPGEITEVNGYSVTDKKCRKTHINGYFEERFGRNDFAEIHDRRRLGEAVGYLVKYIEKTGERIVCSKGLPQFFISDIMDEDVVCRTGMEDKKLLLYDDFSCWDEGAYMGTVSGETIELMQKSN